MILRRWSWLVVIPLALFVAAGVVRYTVLRRDVRSELGEDLFAPLHLAQADVDAWSRNQVTRARSTAALIAGERPLDRAPAAIAAEFIRVAQITTALDSSAAWLVTGDGRVLAAFGDSAVPAPVPVPPATVGYITTPPCGPRFCAEVRAAVDSTDVATHFVVLRAPITESTFTPPRPVRRTRRGTTVLLARDGDTIRVLARVSRDTTVVRAAAVHWESAPAHVQEAFATRQRTGTANAGLLHDQVLYASAPIAARDWILLREIDGEGLVITLLGPLAAETAFVAALLLLAFAWARARVRASKLERERELARVRSDFVAAVSHELRTPLAQIRMFAELLRSGRIRKEQEIERSLYVIEKEASRLSILVDNVINHARLSHGRPLLPPGTPVSTDIGRDVRYVVESFLPLAAEKAVRIENRVTDSQFAAVDSQTFRQILLNLLENAVKYGPRGQTVTIAAAPDVDFVDVTVTDEGPGVSGEEQESIWLPFERGSAAAAGGAGGAGIGLSVVRELVVQNGGRVAVETCPGGGARFTVAFRRARNAEHESHSAELTATLHGR